MDRPGGFDHQLKKTKRKREKVKVVYISSPVKVKTTASEFRALVQELTGRHSDVSRFMETNGGHDHYNSQSTGLVMKSAHDRVMVDPYRESPTSSESWVDQQPTFDDFLIRSHAQDSFVGMFCSSIDGPDHQLDVLGDYYAL